MVYSYVMLYTLGTQKHDKLHSLQRSLPEGLVADAAWLEANGYSGALRKKYVAHGWLDQVVRGVYRRPVPELAQQGVKNLPCESVVISLQTLLKAYFVVGGRTALELQGFVVGEALERPLPLLAEKDPQGEIARGRCGQGASAKRTARPGREARRADFSGWRPYTRSIRIGDVPLLDG